MSKEVRIKVIKHAEPDLRKLARALLLLVERQASEESAVKPTRKAS